MTEKDWNAEVIAEFRANDGEVAGPIEHPPPMLLVHTIWARTSREHITPMRCRPEGNGWYIFASAHGSTRNPDWYHNIVANPEIEIELGTETIPVWARIVTGDERDRIFALHAAMFPIFAEYESTLERTIPVVHLTRR
jgi:deazaflavin-dependent oxidoreductase (nitroreductase family)